MTNTFATDRTELDRHSPHAVINGDLRQFRRLQHLPDHEVAHRMARTLREVRVLRQQFGSGKVRLRDIGMAYQLRFILGGAKIKTLGDVQARSDAELLALPTIGQKRLAQIRNTVKEYLENV